MRNDELIAFLEVQHKSMETVIKANGTAIRAKVEAEIDRIDSKVSEVIKHQEKQNGKMETMEDETRVVRWFQKNPIKTAVIAALFVGALVLAYHIVDFEGTLKSRGIELKDK